MSRFFSAAGGAAASSDESSSSEDDSENDSETEQEVEEAPKPAASGPKPAANAFMKTGDADSDSDDDGKRVVRSHKDKRWDQMTETITKMKNSMKNNDWNAVTDDFASLHKLLEKAKQIVAKEGVPLFYFKALLSLDVVLQKSLADKPAIKKMSKTNAKSLNGMKQNLRKKMAEHETKLAEVKKAGGIDGSDSDDDDMSESESEDSSSSDDDDAPKGKSAFMKSAPKPAKPSAKESKAAASKKAEEEEKNIKALAKKEEAKGPKQIKDYNEAEIDDRCNLILSLRGRKGNKTEDQISVLGQLADVTKRPSKLIELISHVIAFTFDIRNSMIVAMPVPMWHAVMGHFKRLLQCLVDNPELKVEYTESASVIDTQQNTQVELEEGGDPEEDFIDSGVTQLTGSVLSYLERLDDEFYKSLQALDPQDRKSVV